MNRHDRLQCGGALGVATDDLIRDFRLWVLGGSIHVSIDLTRDELERHRDHCNALLVLDDEGGRDEDA